MNNVFKGKVDTEIAIKDLILLGLYLLSQKERKATFETLLEQCFKLSPENISFENHEWPDARKLARPLRSLREENLVEGSPQSVYSLTKKGKKEALKIKKKLYQGKLL